jgi:hypothetical protein
MKFFKLVALFLMVLFVCSTVPAVSATNTHEYNTITVKQGDFFKLPLPATPEDKNMAYWWTATCDQEYFNVYGTGECGDMDRSYVFEALKPGTRTIIMQLHALNLNNYKHNITKTIEYAIKIDC